MSLCIRDSADVFDECHCVLETAGVFDECRCVLETLLVCLMSVTVY